MAARSIEWHEECLKNRRSCCEQMLREYQYARSRYERLAADCQKLRDQIDRAKRLGKKSFDADRFKAGD